MFLGEA